MNKFPQYSSIYPYKKFPFVLLLASLIHLLLPMSAIAEIVKHGEQDLGTNQISGYRLINKFGCKQCHTSDIPYLKKSPASDIEKLSNSFTRSYLSAFLKGQTYSSAYHPVVGGDEAEVEKNTEALLSYLTSSESDLETVQTDIETSGASALYESIGCAVCHGSRDSFSDLSRKYTFEGLRDMLINPLEYFPTGKMPGQNLTFEEAHSITDYLLKGENELLPAESLKNSKEKLNLVARGRIIFKNQQCGSCHSASGVERSAPGGDLHSLDLQKGCLSNDGQNGIQLNLSVDQKAQIRSALDNKKEISAAQEIHLTMEDFNCYACHERSGIGGVNDKLDSLFLTEDPNLGEQGRIPPKLDNVGAKLNSTWLRRIIVQGSRSRPYMKTRMPAFGANSMERLIELIQQVDHFEPLEKVSYPREMRMSNNGRQLAGSDGMACITCHTFKGKKPGAMGALDLTIMAQRLNRTWFHEYMMDPQAFSPNTLMPAFWAGGNVPKKDVLDGDPFKQIDGLWEYLSEGYGAGSPKGIQRPRIEIKAKGNEAVILRRSFPGIGKRGIGVGFPNGFNIAFSAERPGLAMMWLGDFVNAAGVWSGQGHGAAHPLSREVFRFPHQPDVLALPQRDSAWPEPDSRPETHKFLGYKLDKWRNPTFKYKLNGSILEDSYVTPKALKNPKLEQLIDKNKPGLIRQITISSELSSALTFRVAKHKSLKQSGAQSFEMDSKISIEIIGADEAFLVEGEETELRIHLSDVSQSAPITIYYTKLGTQ